MRGLVWALALWLCASPALAAYKGNLRVVCGSSGTVSNGAGATDFIGIANLSTTETTVEFPLPFAGTVTALYVQSAIAAGGGKTFTYTLDVAGVASAVTTTISGASQTSNNDTAHSATVSAGQALDLKLVTSASSGTGPQSFCLGITSP